MNCISVSLATLSKTPNKRLKLLVQLQALEKKRQSFVIVREVNYYYFFVVCSLSVLSAAG